MNIEQIQQAYEAGNKEITAMMKNGEKQKLRLFISTYGDLCYFAKGHRRSGYRVGSIVNEIESIVTKDKKTVTVLEREVNNLRKFKKAFTIDAHPNLWADLRESYNRLNPDDFMNFAIEKGLQNASDTFAIYKCLCEYCSLHKLDLEKENNWKTTTIKSNAPEKYSYSRQYEDCIKNIKAHLENKENFRYHWRSNYDVSISAELNQETGIYHAWFSLEYRGCGNGHYYLLINENQAVFAEDD